MGMRSTWCLDMTLGFDPLVSRRYFSKSGVKEVESLGAMTNKNARTA